jgi:hypothetical protein
MPFARYLLVGSDLLDLQAQLALREQTKTPPRWTVPAAKNGAVWEAIYGSAFHRFGSGGVRGVFRGA